MTDCLSKETIESLLSPKSPFTIQVYDCIASTNTVAKEFARGGAPEGLVILADRQTGGYGRYGRRFYSPRGTGLYMSVLLRPTACASEDALLITTAAAVAVAEAIETVVGKCCGIKWVNDLILDGKKVCGILTEGAFRQDSPILDYAVLGIGVNVTVPEDDFHEEIRDIAGALAHEPVHNLRNRLVAEILQRFEGYYANLAQKAFLASYRKRLFFLGKTIRVLRGGLEFSATAVTLDEDLRLVVRYDDGREEALSSGEIAIKL